MPPSNGSCLLSFQASLRTVPQAFVEGPQQDSFQVSWLFLYSQLREQTLALGGMGGGRGWEHVKSQAGLVCLPVREMVQCFTARSEMSGLFLSGAVPWTTLPHCSSFPLAPLQLLAGSRKGRTVLSTVHTKGLPFPALLARGAWGRGEGWGKSPATPLRLSIYPSDSPVGTSRTNSKAKRRGTENRQTS